jgi:hypothetical protein
MLLFQAAILLISCERNADHLRSKLIVGRPARSHPTKSICCYRVPRAFPVTIRQPKRTQISKSLVAVGESEDWRAGPMVNGNPWPVRVFQVVDDFDGTRNRYVGHKAAIYRWPPVARR